MLLKRYRVHFSRFSVAEVTAACGFLTWAIPDWFEAGPSPSARDAFAGRVRATAMALDFADHERLNAYDCAASMLWYAMMDGRGVIYVEGDPAFFELDEQSIGAIAALEDHEVKSFVVAWPGMPSGLLSQAEFEAEIGRASQGRPVTGVELIDLRDLALDVAASLARPLITLRPIHNGQIGRK